MGRHHHPHHHRHHHQYPRHRRPYEPLVPVLRIPADGSKPYVDGVDACTYYHSDSDTLSASTTALEAQLVDIPDLYKFRHYTDLRYLELFNRNLDAELDRHDYGGTYYIYKCIDGAEARLPANQCFAGLGEARVYGDAFVFNVKEVRMIDEQWRAVFDEMHSFERSLKNRGFAWRMLMRMARW